MTANHQNVFAGAFVDRSSERRKDPEWLGHALQSDDSRFIPIWRQQSLVAGDPPAVAMLSRDQLGRPVDEDDLVFLGIFRDHPTFAIGVDDEQAPFLDRGEFHELRHLGAVLPLDEANLVAHARALVIWHATQVYCGRCGAEARPGAGGNLRVCSDPACRQQIFPRVDPAIIVLVSHGQRCLLGRQPSWPEGRYATIAGFVEPGESLEDAVRREVYEETNVRVGAVRYHSSQPWPFPSSLMLGFFAEALTTDIELNDGELEDARWFTREDLRSDFPKLPYRISISRALVDDWIDDG